MLVSPPTSLHLERLLPRSLESNILDGFSLVKSFAASSLRAERNRAFNLSGFLLQTSASPTEQSTPIEDKAANSDKPPALPMSFAATKGPTKAERFGAKISILLSTKQFNFCFVEFRARTRSHASTILFPSGRGLQVLRHGLHGFYDHYRNDWICFKSGLEIGGFGS